MQERLLPCGAALLLALAGCQAAAPEPAPSPAEPTRAAAPVRPPDRPEAGQKEGGDAAGAQLAVAASAAPGATTGAAQQARPRTADADRRARMQRSMRAMSIVGLAFQADADPTRLTFDELERSFDAYDADGDQAITAAEFAARPLARRDGPGERQAGEPDPWTALLEGLDGDRDGALDFDELEAFFIRRDDGDGVWRLEGRSR